MGFSQFQTIYQKLGLSPLLVFESKLERL